MKILVRRLPREFVQRFLGFSEIRTPLVFDPPLKANVTTQLPTSVWRNKDHPPGALDAISRDSSQTLHDIADILLLIRA